MEAACFGPLFGSEQELPPATLIAANSGDSLASFYFRGRMQALRGNVINGLWTAFIGWFSKVQP